MALPRQLRFRSRRDIRAVLQHGERFRTDLGRVAWRRAKDESGRLLFVVGRAVSRKSVVRHRIQRELDGQAGRYFAERPSRRDAVIIVDPGAANLTRRLLRQSAREAIRRLEARRS